MAKVELFLKLYLLLPNYTAGVSVLDVTLTDDGSMYDTDLLTEIEVDWNDGNTTTVTEYQSTFAHTYSTGGTYSIVLTFTDSSGRVVTQTIPVIVGAASGFNYTFNFNIQ